MRIVATGVALLALSGCSASTSSLGPSLMLTTVPQSRTSMATISTDAGGSRPLSQPLSITARDGRLTTVTVTGPRGTVQGVIAPDGKSWTVESRHFSYGSHYQLTATAVDARGVPTTMSSSFDTVTPIRTFTASITPNSGGIVGVGMPITVVFSRPIRDKKAVQESLVVHTPTALEGAWSWRSAKEVQFRPRTYWPAYTSIQVDANLTGVRSKPGVFGAGDVSASFSTGASMVTHVNAMTDQASVYRDGQLLKTIPVTTGKVGFQTRSGTVLIMTKELSRIMDASTGGTAKNDPNYYRVMTHYSMRITDSGEFLHAAPWSVGNQGRANVSHGCVGMSMSNAAWLYGLSQIGDVVSITGTPVKQNQGNGITVWNESWDKWLAGSAAGSTWTVADTALPPAPTPTDTVAPPIPADQMNLPPTATPSPIKPTPAASAVKPHHSANASGSSTARGTVSASPRATATVTVTAAG